MKKICGKLGFGFFVCLSIQSLSDSPKGEKLSVQKAQQIYDAFPYSKIISAINSVEASLKSSTISGDVFVSKSKNAFLFFGSM